MQLDWLRHTGADAVIVLFSGWGIAPDVFTHLDGPQDVLLLQDYRDLEGDLPDLSGYGTASLVAWSFGVAAYGHWQDGRPDPFTRKIAINGSLSPVDRKLGIPPVVFQRTLDGLSVESFQSFLQLSCEQTTPSQSFDLAARRAELEAVQARGPAPQIGFDLAWISIRDRIFPPANQARAWDGTARRIRQRAAPHMPFATWDRWEELLS